MSSPPAAGDCRAALHAVNRRGETVGVAEHIMERVPNPAFGPDGQAPSD